MTQTTSSETQFPTAGKDCSSQSLETTEERSQEPQNITESGSKAGWTVEEKKSLAAVTFPLIEMQKQYGRKMDPKLVMQGWEIKFAGRFTVDQLLFALDAYTDKNDDFPSPNNLIEILEPEPPRISEAQFVQAQKWQERNQNWSEYTDAYDTIQRYKAQEREKRESYEIRCEKIKAIAQGSVKRIGDFSQPERKELTHDKTPV